MEITQGTLAKLLIQEKFLDELIETVSLSMQQAVLSASDDKIIESRREYTGGQQFAGLLRARVEEIMLSANPQMRERHVDP